MGTKNNPGKFDCYTNAEDDEPMFVLLARDEHAPVLVALWAENRRLVGGGDTEKTLEAEQVSLDMRKWRLARRLAKFKVG
jgi:hypothetical protein